MPREKQRSGHPCSLCLKICDCVEGNYEVDDCLHDCEEAAVPDYDLFEDKELP